MKLGYKILSLLFLFVFAAIALQAEEVQKKEFTKVIKKEFSVDDDVEASIFNMHGKVDIKSWEQNKVKISVTIVVNASSESVAESVFERISIAFDHSDDYVKAKTEIKDSKKSWWDWGSDKSDFSINYDVYLPKKSELNLEAKYCDVHIDELLGEAKLMLKYSNFNIGTLGDDTSLAFAYGNGKIGKVEDFSAEVSYGNLAVKVAGDVSILSKYSTVTFDKTEDMECETKYDNYTVGYTEAFRNTGKHDNISLEMADEIRVVGKYSNLSCQQLTESMDLNLEYGAVKIKNIAKGFDGITLEGKYTDFKLDMEAGSDFQLDAFAEYAAIRYPDNLIILFEKDKGTTHEVKGHVGPKGASAIKASLRYGGLKVQ